MKPRKLIKVLIAAITAGIHHTQNKHIYLKI